ncbi:fibroblast growth factor 9-like [Acropora millepora]|uniref:fibroblast growth factor 9-like n=1 Tax=Acropora millepora TaxID=45264 RepID=UPI001CF0FF27|nr:fibroblast growth factor 9-like [Acropora millepora]
MTSPLLISVLVLRSLLLSTNAPINYTRSEVAAEPPTTNAVTSLDTAVKDVDTPSTWMDGRLVTRKGIQLVMLENGTVAGSWNQSLTEKLGLFRIQSHGPTLVKLKSLKTMKYIAISSTGLVYSTANSSNQDALLRHALEENFYYSFSSHLYPDKGYLPTRDWLLAIGNKGQMRNASRVLKGRKSHQFQITELRKSSGRFRYGEFLRAVRNKGR